MRLSSSYAPRTEENTGKTAPGREKGGANGEDGFGDQAGNLRTGTFPRPFRV
jgi:hypothetical protein